MLKKCLFIIMLLLFSSSLFAYEQGDTIFHIKGGYGFSLGRDVYVDATPEFISTWNIGIALEHFYQRLDSHPIFRVSTAMSFIGEVSYENRPLSYKSDYFGKVNHNFTYVTSALGFRVLFSDFFFIGTSLYWAMISGGNTTVDGESIGRLVDLRNDIGLFSDFGLYFQLSESSNLSLFIRSMMGFVELQKGSRLYNNTVGTINLAYGFRF